MQPWVVAVIAILALLMIAISAMVAYLLYRPHARKKDDEKRELDSKNEVATEYGEPPENGDVKIAIPDDHNGTMLPPYSSKESSVHDELLDTKIDIDESEEDTRSDGEMVEELIVPTRDDDGSYSAPASPYLSKDDNRKTPNMSSDSSSMSSSDSNKQPETTSEMDNMLAEDQKSHGIKSSSSSSSSTSDTSDSDGDIPEPMAPISPKILQTDLVSDVLAVVDGKQKREAPSSASETNVDDDNNVPESSGDEKKLIDENIQPVVAPKPRTRLHPDSEEKEKESSSSSSSSSDEDEANIAPSPAPRTQLKKISSTSSSSSDETEDDVKQRTVGISATSTKRRSKRRKKVKKLSSSSSSSDSEDRDIDKGVQSSTSTTTRITTTRITTTERKTKRGTKEMDTKSKSVRSMEQQTERTSSSSSSSDSSSSSSSGNERKSPKALRPQYKITFMSGWGRPVKVEDLHEAGLIDAETLKGLEDGNVNADDVERRLRPYLVGSEPVGGIHIPDDELKISVYSAWERGWISREICVSLLEAQAATGKILDPSTGARYSVDEALKEGLIDKQMQTILNRAERALYGYETSSSPDMLSVYQAIGKKHVSETHGNPLLEAQIATGGVIDPKTNHRVPMDVAYERHLVDSETVNKLQDPSGGSRVFIDPNTKENVPYHELLRRCVRDPDTNIKLLPLHVSSASSMKQKVTNITSPTSTKKGVSIMTQTDLTSSNESSSSTSSTSEGEIDIPMISGEMGTQTMNAPIVKKKKRKAAKTKESPRVVHSSSFVSSSIYSSESEREMHMYNLQGTPRQGPRSFSPPRLEENTSQANEMSTQTLFPSKVKSTRTAVRDRTGRNVTTVHEKGVQMTYSSGSEDETKRTRVRTQKDISIRRVDEKLVSTSIFTREQKNVTSEVHHKVFFEQEEISIDLGHPDEYYKAEKAMSVSAPPPKILFKTSWGRDANLDDLVDAGIVDAETQRKIQAKELDPLDESVQVMVRPYISCNKPIAGVLHEETGQKYTIFDAAKKGLIERSTAVALLEAQAATGNLIDPLTGRKLTVAEARKEGFIAGGYEAIISKASKSVYGYKSETNPQPLSVFEAMKDQFVVPSYGMYLLEVQLATGGIIDPKANHRVPLEAAYRKGLFDQHAMNRIRTPRIDSKGLIDPNTQENATYQEIYARCVTDVDTGVLLFPSLVKKRGRSSKSSLSVSSYTSLHVRSRSRSKSRERYTQTASDDQKSRLSSTSSIDNSRKRESREFKVSSTTIELSKSPVISADEGTLERQKHTSTTSIMVDDSRKFDPLHFKMQEPQAAEKSESSRSRSSSSSSEDETIKTTETVTVTETITIEKPQEFETVHLEVKDAESVKESESYSSSSSSSSSSEDETVQSIEHTTVSETVATLDQAQQKLDPVDIEVHESQIVTKEESSSTSESDGTAITTTTTTTTVVTTTITKEEREEGSSSSSSSEDEMATTTTDTTTTKTAVEIDSMLTALESSHTEIRDTQIITKEESSSSSSSEDEGIETETDATITKTAVEVDEMKDQLNASRTEVRETQIITKEESSSSSSSEDEQITTTSTEIAITKTAVEVDDVHDKLETSHTEIRETQIITKEESSSSSSSSSSEDEQMTTTSTEIAITKTAVEVDDVHDKLETSHSEIRETQIITKEESSSSSSSDEEKVETSSESTTTKAAIKVDETEDNIDSTVMKVQDSQIIRTAEQITTSADHQTSSNTETSTTTTVITTTEIITEKSKRKKSRHDIKFRSGWNRQASLADLFSAGVISKETVQNLEEGVIEEEEVEDTIKQYLVGAEPIAGLLLSSTGEKVSIYSAWKRSFIRRGTSISLLEAQAATGRILDPVSGKRYSVAEASKERLIDRQFEAVLARAERAVTGYTTRTSKEVFSLFQAMKRKLVMENHGIRLLEAQIATGGIIDPKANHRLPIEVAYERGLFDKRMNEILEDPGDDTRGFFDPNTNENLTYLELMERCITDTDTGMRLLPFRTHRDTSMKRSKVVFESKAGRQVTLKDLVNASRVDSETADRIDEGTITIEEKDVLVAKLRVFVDGTMPIAGIINTTNGERMSIYEAAKCELIRKGTAFELLEAQACCGKIIDVQTGRLVTIKTALQSGIIDTEYKDVVERAHRAVTGYTEPYKRELLSLCEAINRHMIVKRHGMRLLEAQIATGGIIDVKSPVRISPQVALKRALLDTKLADELEQRNTQSYFDPVTGENLNYSELMGRCVKDKDTGLLFLMVEGGTVTSYARPFEEKQASKIRSQQQNAGRLTTEEVSTVRSSSSSLLDTTTTTTESVRKKKKRSKKTRSSTTSSTGDESSTGTESDRISMISRKVIIVDPDTNEEITVREALKRRLIDKATAKQLIAQQGDFEAEGPP